MRYEKNNFYFIYVCLALFGNSVTATDKFELDSNDTDNMEGYGLRWMYFPDGNGIPHRISLVLPPSPVQTDILSRIGIGSMFEDIEFRLYTRDNADAFILLDESAKPLNVTSTNTRAILDKLSKRPIKLVTHGWESSADNDGVINIKNAYLKAQDVNVVAVDWSAIAQSILYPLVALDTKKVGSSVGRFLNALYYRYEVSGGDIHLIGHSLGAHVMGNAGQESAYKVGRITGLDPASPLFEFPFARENSVKLDLSDADFVDIIHTCGGILGVKEKIGHVDFFPNSGSAPQPGCGNVQKYMEACSHGRAHHYFAESIENPKAFPSFQCKTWTEYLQNMCSGFTFMGEAVNRSATGNFYLSTNYQNPYGRAVLI